MNTTTERTEALLDRHGKSVTAEVYWDTGDPNNVGWAYRITWDGTGQEKSGACERPNPWQDVYEFLGPDAAYSDGSPLPLATNR
jgi:hypothetical protein